MIAPLFCPQSLDNLFNNIISSIDLGAFSINANSKKELYTVQHNGIHLFNFVYLQSGVTGSDDINFLVNDTEKLKLVKREETGSQIIYSSIFLNLKIGDIISLKTTNSSISSGGNVSYVHVYSRF